VTDLVDVITWDGVVERTVEIIQQFNDLYRTTFRRQHRESDDIRKVDRRARIHLWSHITSRFQLVRNKTASQGMMHTIYRPDTHTHTRPTALPEPLKWSIRQTKPANASYDRVALSGTQRDARSRTVITIKTTRGITRKSYVAKYPFRKAAVTTRLG